MMQYTPYEMLYASHVIQGLRTIESVPSVLRENVQAIVDNAVTVKK